MSNLTLEAKLIEGAVCSSDEKQLRVHRHATTGRNWIEIGDRRYVGRDYLEALEALKAENKLELSESRDDHDVYELGEHVCVRVLGRHE